jgi:hypothetical protein
MKRIAFTGHRDSVTVESELDAIRALSHSGTVWVHGGASGFDRQVACYAARYNIQCECIRPDYNRYQPKIAPLIRNRQIVDGADLLVACYDGRRGGGTAYTIKYAQGKSIPVKLVRCIKD